MFAGLSTLRSKEKTSAPVTEETKKLQSYLKKYTEAPAKDTAGDIAVKKRKKKKKDATLGALKIVDQDVSGFRAVSTRREEKLSRPEYIADDFEADDEEGPTIANPEEAKRAAELVEKVKSGAAMQNWVSLEEPSRATNADRRGASPDLDVPRKVNASAGLAAKRRRHDSPGLDAATAGELNGAPVGEPPRRKARYSSPDLSPVRRKPQDSPVREKHAVGSSDHFPQQHRQRHDSPDSSPVRRGSLLSPVRSTGQGGSPDLSPVRRGKRHDSPDLARAQTRQRHDSPDLSPVRRNQSPEVEPPRRGQRHDSPDIEVPRRGARDASPSPLEGQARQSMPPPAARGAPGEKGSSGARGGKIAAADLKRELDAKRRAERERFARMDASESGANAETVYRDKQGRRVNLAELQEERDAAKKPAPERPEWGGGLTQMQRATQEVEEMRREAARPFARSKDDTELDAELRDRVRFGDPMAHLVKQKPVEPPPPVIGEFMREKLAKYGGFVIPQEVPPHSWLKRRISAPPNRYNIKPGRHWDGVDRSTGFEQQFFKTMNARAARDVEAHMWSQSDM